MLANIVLLASLAAPPSSSPLTGCSALPLEDSGWMYDCGERGRATIWDKRMAPTLLDSVLHASAGIPGSTASEERRTLAGKKVVVLLQASPEARQLATSLERTEGTRILKCFAPADGAWCDGVLVLLAGLPWRGGPVAGSSRAPPRGLTLRGKPVPLPEWCQGKVVLEGGGHVSCRKLEHNWPRFALWLPCQDEAHARGMIANWQAVIDRQLRVIEEEGAPFSAAAEVPCRLAGKPTTCVRRSNAAIVVMWGISAEGEDVVAGACLGDVEDMAEPPCAILFASP